MSHTDPPIEQVEFVTFAGQLIQKESDVYLNVGQEFIVTTGDKIRLCLGDHLSRMEKRRAWITPLGILLTIVIVFPTTTFQTFIVPAEVWQAIFMICCAISSGWLIFSICQARVSTSINDVIADIKKTAFVRKAGNAVPPSTTAQMELTIHSAKYGAQDKWNDVTQLLRSRASAGRLELLASNEILGGDPIKTVVKVLIVDYSYDGKRYTKEISENAVLSLP